MRIASVFVTVWTEWLVLVWTHWNYIHFSPTLGEKANQNFKFFVILIFVLIFLVTCNLEY